MNLADALAELDCHSVETLQRPNWLILTEEQIRTARYVISDSFLSLKTPFEDDGYKRINFPFNLGKIQDTQMIINSKAYADARGERSFWYARGVRLPDEFSYLQGVCEQYDLVYRILYGQKKVLWHFQADTRMLYPGDVQRPIKNHSDTDESAPTDEPFHIDNNLDCDWVVDKMRSDIGMGGHAFMIDEKLFIVGDTLVKAVGFPSTFLSVFATPEKECLTQFRNASIQFSNWDILHFMAEPHRSPPMVKPCKRFVLQGLVRPIVTVPLSQNKAAILNIILKQNNVDFRLSANPHQNNNG